MADERAKRRAELAEKMKKQVAYPQAKFLHEAIERDITPTTACDVCNAQGVEVSRSWVTGVETFACEKCSR